MAYILNFTGSDGIHIFIEGCQALYPFANNLSTPLLFGGRDVAYGDRRYCVVFDGTLNETDKAALSAFLATLTVSLPSGAFGYKIVE